MSDLQQRREDAQSWWTYATHDLIAAGRAMQEPALPEIALFHAQQAAEKALKACLIVAGGDDIPRTHLLRNLVRALDELGAATPSPEAIRFLDVYGVTVRYPDTPIPDVETVMIAIDQAAHILDFVQAQLESSEGRHGQSATDDSQAGEGDTGD